jgi:hypothetical protein
MADHIGGDFPTLSPPGGTPKITSIFDFSAEALGQLRLWLEQNPPSVPISSVLGFQQFTAQSATKISTNEATNSTTYTDLATTGPEITGLPDGKYVIFFGAYGRCSSNAGGARMSVDVDGVGAHDADAATWNVTDAAPGSTACLKTLSNAGNNTLTAKYRTDSTMTGTFADRWMIALRYANS